MLKDLMWPVFQYKVLLVKDFREEPVTILFEGEEDAPQA